MAKKKEPTVADAVNTFKEVMKRASLSSYYHVNAKLLSPNVANNMILVIPESGLWERLQNDQDIKPIELDITDPSQSLDLQWFAYGEDLENCWVPIDMNEELFHGKVFKIKLRGWDYQVPVNRDFMPLKLKKAEYNNISYRMFSKPGFVLAIKKYFESQIEGLGFTVIRLFKVV